MLNKCLLFILLCGVLLSVQKYNTGHSTSWPTPIQNPSKYTSSAGFELGRALFYDPILSADSSISCASCHLSYTAFAHVDHPTSHGVDNRIGKRNAPGLFNLAWRSNFHWDGGVLNLSGQAINPLTHPDEMGESLAHVLEKLNAQAIYKQYFERVYKQRKIQTWMLLDALQQFTIALVSNNSLYDRVQKKESTFTPQQASGFQLFQNYCNRCHEAPLFFSNRFEYNGISNSNDLGRYEITGIPADKNLFRVPSLRNITHTFPYMHDGRFKTLKEVLQRYATEFELNENAQKDLIAFLKTLTDSSFIFNPEFQYHTLTPKP
ncbi:MAG: cytochrome-c peroxidase [Flavobacteriales bacterium]